MESAKLEYDFKKRAIWFGGSSLQSFAVSPFTKGFIPSSKLTPLAEHSSGLVFDYTLYFLSRQVLTLGLCFWHARLIFELSTSC